uniref:Uncharacterized protein n=1 Tax=Pyricularia oryzae (strain 70-15 / ATCC MYA-4617 / FGSC 8958) TaxID=242507 RepID=Q2KFB7_PYRO7|nr:hypothetical protein MGCH7_ch7g769 [Pyricularia oryzae 70-15]
MNALAAEIAPIDLVEQPSDAVAVAEHLAGLATPLDPKLALFAVGQVDALVLCLVRGEVARHVLRRAHALHHPVGVAPLVPPSLARGVAFGLDGRREQGKIATGSYPQADGSGASQCSNCMTISGRRLAKIPVFGRRTQPLCRTWLKFYHPA